MIRQIRVAVTTAPGHTDGKPRYGLGSVRGVYRDGSVRPEWGDGANAHLCVKITDEQEKDLRAKKIKLAPGRLEGILGSQGFSDTVERAWIIQQHHIDVHQELVTHISTLNESEQQILAIAETMNPVNIERDGQRKEARRVFIEHAERLWRLVKTKIADGQTNTFTQCETVIKDAVTKGEHKARDRELSGLDLGGRSLQKYDVPYLQLPEMLIEKLMGAYSDFRSMHERHEEFARTEIKAFHPVIIDDKIHDLTDGTAFVEAPEWEQPTIVTGPDEEFEGKDIIGNKPLGSWTSVEPFVQQNFGFDCNDPLNPLDPTYTVGTGKTYATIQAAIDAIPGNLSGGGVQMAEVYATAAGKYPENPDYDIGFSGEGAANYIHVKAMVSNEGQRATGIIIEGQRTPGVTLKVVTMGKYSRLTGFGITVDGTHNATVWVVNGAYGVGGNVRVIGNVVYDVDAALNIYGIIVKEYTNYIWNNMVMNLEGTGAGSLVIGIYCHRLISNTTDYMYNNSVLNVSAPAGNPYGFWLYNSANTTYILTNNYVGNSGTDYHQNQALGTVTVTYCISSDATANDWGGAGNLINKAAANQFVNATVGSEDLHLKAGADCIRTGADLSGTFTDDIDGGIRVDWNTGADEFGVPVVGGNPALHTTMVLGGI